MTQESLKALIEDLRLNHEFCPKDVILQAADELERMQQGIETLHALREALAQPEQEPVAIVTSETGNPDITMSWWHEPALPVGTKLYTQPSAAAHTSADIKNTPPPDWEAIDNIIAEYGLQAIDFVADWKAAQRPWQGLTDDEIKEIVGPWGDTPIKGYTRQLFDQIEAKLKDKQNDQ